jgi:predicted metal-dependent HD superfamily phosphohydrolase
MSANESIQDPEILALMDTCAYVRYGVDRDVRKYHNYMHALAVIDAIREINRDARLHLVIAALYHDAVYVPGAGSDANELCSAAALAVDWAKCRLESAHPVLHAAQILIKQTSVATHLSEFACSPDSDLAVLLDADLAGLAAELDVFIAAQCNIIRENGAAVNEESLDKCARFLKQFLEVRGNIYHTEYARANWEAKARFNIEHFVHEYLTS